MLGNWRAAKIVRVANHHFAELGDVWKHLVLAEVLAAERPRRYWETHAGSAAYPLTRSPGRDYGVYRFLEGAARSSVLGESRYFRLLARLADGRPSPFVCPGSALLAMSILGDAAEYLLCDLDGESLADLRRWAARSGVADRVETVRADGMGAVWERSAEADPATILVHVDPFDPHATGPAGLSAVALASRLIGAGFGVAYWYGYDEPTQRAWAYLALADRPGPGPLWCGDVMLRAAADATSAEEVEALGRVAGPGAGCGVVCANLAASPAERCAELGVALVEAYRGSRLPNGQPGDLDFRAYVA